MVGFASCDLCKYTAILKTVTSFKKEPARHVSCMPCRWDHTIEYLKILEKKATFACISFIQRHTFVWYWPCKISRLPAQAIFSQMQKFLITPCKGGWQLFCQLDSKAKQLPHPLISDFCDWKQNCEWEWVQRCASAELYTKMDKRILFNQTFGKFLMWQVCTITHQKEHLWGSNIDVLCVCLIWIQGSPSSVNNKNKATTKHCM